MQIERQSDPILRLLESSQAVEDSVTVHGPIIAPLLEERFAPRIGNLEGEQPPAILPTLFTLRDDLGASREELAEIEERNMELERQISDLSDERADLFENLQEDFTWLRGHFEKILGPGKAEKIAGLQGPTATSSAKLLRQVRVAVRQLSKPDLELAESRFGAVQTDPQVIITGLENRADRFRTVLAELRILRRELQVTQEEKNAMVDRHKKTFASISQTLEGLYRLAGKDRLADRIKPSQVKRGRRAAEVEEAPNGDSPEGASANGAPANGVSSNGVSANGDSPQGESKNAEPAPSAAAASGATEKASGGALIAGTPAAGTPAAGTPAVGTPVR